MTTYRVTFTPLEPYFFGGDKSRLLTRDRLTETDALADVRHLIRSETLPSQSTLWGTLRYLCLPVKRADWQYTAEEAARNAAAVGEAGFDPAESRTFGKLHALSPLFLWDGDTELLPAPFDHTVGEATYTPFRDYRTVQTPEGERLYAADYRAKNGITHDFMRLDTGRIVPREELFFRQTRTLANRKGRFMQFSRESVRLREGYAFGVYLTVEDDLVPQNTVAFMGQCRSAFMVAFTRADDRLDERMAALLPPRTVYCASDAFLSPGIYRQCAFAATDLRTYRTCTFSATGVTKSKQLHRLITAGSVFIPRDDAFYTAIRHPSAETVGYNRFVTRNGGIGR